MERGNRKSIFIRAIILFVMPALWTSLYCLFDGKTIFEVSLLNSTWNDELLYYKLVENVLAFGYPRGYFGYNEMHANLLSFGAWSPIILLQWVIWGAVFGWNLLSPILSNLVTFSLALGIFALLAKPSKLQTALIAILLGVYRPFSRFTLSCIPEIELISIMIVFMGLVFYVAQDSKGTFHKKSIVGMYVLILLATLMRPYLILFMALPLYFSLKETKTKCDKITSWIRFCVVFLITVGLYAVISVLFNAPYIEDIIYTDWLVELKKNLIGGIVYTFSKIISSVKTMVGLMYLNLFAEGFHASGLYYFVYGVTGILVAVHLIYTVFCLKKGNNHINRKLVFAEIVTFVEMFAFFVADLLMYNVVDGGRHTFVYMAVCIILMPFAFTNTKKNKELSSQIPLAIWAMVIFAVLACGNVPYEYDIPYYAYEKDNSYTELSNELQNNMVPDSKTLSYDNTVVWTWGTDIHEYTYYYAIPKGFGINLCLEDYVLENFDSLQSKYIGAGKGSLVEEKCVEAGLPIVGNCDEYAIYRLR